jgi:hypothetical protein
VFSSDRPIKEMLLPRFLDDAATGMFISWLPPPAARPIGGPQDRVVLLEPPCWQSMRGTAASGFPANDHGYRGRFDLDVGAWKHGVHRYVRPNRRCLARDGLKQLDELDIHLWKRHQFGKAQSVLVFSVPKPKLLQNTVNQFATGDKTQLPRVPISV